MKVYEYEKKPLQSTRNTVTKQRLTDFSKSALLAFLIRFTKKEHFCITLVDLIDTLHLKR